MAAASRKIVRNIRVELIGLLLVIVAVVPLVMPLFEEEMGLNGDPKISKKGRKDGK